MADLYLESYSRPDDGSALVPLETLISLFILELCGEKTEVKVRLVVSSQGSSPGFKVKCHHDWVSQVPEKAQCVLPVLLLTNSQTCVAGICAVLRQICKLSDKCRPLLGFREGCLMSCAEVSKWTKFCEVDIINVVKSITSTPQFHSPVSFPRDVAKFERHMAQPLRIHNIKKITQDMEKLNPGKNLEHCFADGPTMTLSDAILFPCYTLIFSMLNSVYLCQYLPLTHKWYDLVSQQTGFQTAVSIISHVETKVEDQMFVKYIVPEMPSQSLYKGDPRRYKSKERQFTRQDELDKSLLLVPEQPEWSPEPFGWDVEFDWGAVPPDAHPTGGQLPASRLDRKCQQLENLAKAVLKIAKCGDIIVDFCSGAGHLGIILAHFLPRCHVVLLENKEESLKRARERVTKLNLSNVSFYQCNLDYFRGSFDIGVSLHACGVATDLVIQCCLQKSAAFVCCPCCYGSIQANHSVSYPRSQKFRDTAMSLRDYLVIGHSADQTHDENNHKTSQGRFCMGIIDLDRILQANEVGYQVYMARLIPETCSPKNNLIVGVPKIKL